MSFINFGGSTVPDSYVTQDEVIENLTATSRSLLLLFRLKKGNCIVTASYVVTNYLKALRLVMHRVASIITTIMTIKLDAKMPPNMPSTDDYYHL